KKAKDLIIKYGDIRGIQSNRDALMKSKVYSRILESPHILTRNEELMDMTRIPVDGKLITVDGEEFQIEGIKEYVKETLESETSFEKEMVRTFLMSKQMVSILKDFNTLSTAFSTLK